MKLRSDYCYLHRIILNDSLFLQGHSELTYEYLKTGHPRTIINATGDLCKFLNGSRTEPLIKWFFDLIGPHLPPGLAHPCPYTGYVTCKGLSIFGDQVYFFPDGIYTYKLRMFNDDDPNILSLKVDVEVTGTKHGDARF